MEIFIILLLHTKPCLFSNKESTWRVSNTGQVDPAGGKCRRMDCAIQCVAYTDCVSYSRNVTEKNQTKSYLTALNISMKVTLCFICKNETHYYCLKNQVKTLLLGSKAAHAPNELHFIKLTAIYYQKKLNKLYVSISYDTIIINFPSFHM